MAPAPGARVPVPIPRHRGQHPDDGAARVAVAGLVLYLVDGLAYFPAGRVLPVGFCRVHGFVTSRFLVLLNLNPRGVFRRTSPPDRGGARCKEDRHGLCKEQKPRPDTKKNTRLQIWKNKMAVSEPRRLFGAGRGTDHSTWQPAP